MSPLANGTTIEESRDFHPGAGLEGWGPVLAEFLGFLSWYTSCDHDVCPFAPGWHEWCAAHEQEIENLRCELEPDGE